MAKTPLRTYIKDVENLIERGEIEKAIAHAKNILKTYPKHIETYRLLGKAYLESQRYSDATDILQRVLSVIPDDFVSQLGMSIIREDEANLDAAIWHMERAYEVQPFNPAVQDELRRLYGRRDGIEPPKIRLTRGALIRMYARGELYPQAIAETRAALAEDPQRQDLQVLLARLYFMNGQKVEAAEVCSALISKLPYCYEANLILTEVLPGTSRAEDAKTFQQRLYALDPYAAFVSPNAQTASQVPDQAVTVEQFLFEAALEQQDQRPDWARNVGVEWQETEEEQLPDWLNTLAPNEKVTQPAQTQPPSQSTQQPETTAPAEQDQDAVPEWMKAAGWAKTDRSADEIAKEQLIMATAQAPDEAEEAAPAEIPDWLQTMAPAVDTDEQAKEQERFNLLESILPGSEQPKEEEPALPALDDESLDWLSQGSATAAGAAALNAADLFGSEQADPAASETPDWLTGLGQAGETAPQADTSTDQPPANTWALDGAPTATADATPDWLSELDDTSEMPAAPQPSMDWLARIGEETPLESESPAGAGDSIPDWIQPVDQENAYEAEGTASTSWMSSLEDERAAETLAAPSELTATEEALSTPDEALPDWLIGAETDTIIPAPVIAQSLAPDFEQPPAQPPAETVIAFPQVDVEPILIDLAADSSASVAAEAGQPTNIPDLNDMDAAMAWLESLAAKQGADEATLVTRPEDRLANPPDWIGQEIPASESQAEVQPEANAPIEVSAPAEGSVPDAEVGSAFVTEVEPNQIVEAEAEQQTTSDMPALEAELPDWLQSIEPETLAAPQPVDQPVRSDNWMTELQAETSLESEVPSASQEQPAQEIKPMSDTAPTAVPDFADMDAAMAWLESLAAKQGADEATLVTRPEDRVETPPDWVQQITEEPASIVEEPGASTFPPEVGQEEPTQPVRISLPVDDQTILVEPVDQAADLSIELPVTLENPPAEEATLPEWMQAEEQAPAEATELPDWLASEIQLEAAADQSEPPTQVETPQTSDLPIAEAVSNSEPGAMPDFSDMDAAMAWLESLAAKQGADEATLVTKPEDRLEAPPDWVKQEMAQTVPAASMFEEESELAQKFEIETQLVAEQALEQGDSQPVIDEPEAVIETLAITSPEEPVEVPAAETAAEQSTEMDFDASFAWLESLAARQGAQEGSLITAPDERQVDTPEWVQHIASDASASESEPTAEVKPLAAEANGWLTEDQAPATEMSTTVPTWFENTIDEDMAIDQGAPTNVDDTPVEWLPEQPESQSEVAEPTSELPAWLQQVEAEDSKATAETSAAAPKASLEDWLHSLENEKETFPSIPVEETDPILADAWQEQPPATPAVIDTSLTGQAALTAAQTALNRGQLDPAMDIYNRFITNGELLEEVIHDLRDALYRYPVDISVWQALGDAFARNNQLQEALDAYTKAEELLR